MLRAVDAKTLSEAWSKYQHLFGEPPHGTEKQLAAMLEFVHDENFMVLPLEVARLVNNGFLPINPNKLRNADPDVKRACVEFRSELERKLRLRTERSE